MMTVCPPSLSRVCRALIKVPVFQKKAPLSDALSKSCALSSLCLQTLLCNTLIPWVWEPIKDALLKTGEEDTRSKTCVVFFIEKKKKSTQAHANISDWENSTLLERERERERLSPVGACKMCEHLGRVHSRLSTKKGTHKHPPPRVLLPCALAQSTQHTHMLLCKHACVSRSLLPVLATDRKNWWEKCNMSRLC